MNPIDYWYQKFLSAEKKYKDALNLARSYYDKNTNQFLDTIFPELNTETI